MDNIVIAGVHHVTEADLRGAVMGIRFSRLDLLSRLAVLAVEPLSAHFGATPRDRIGICLSARAGSISTDVEYWEGRDRVGGPSPTLFAYTLPSSAIGEIAIRHRLRGPNLCWVGHEERVMEEAGELLRRGEADACLCLACDVVTPGASSALGETPAARAAALYLRRGGEGARWPGENDRDTVSLFAIVSAREFGTKL